MKKLVIDRVEGQYTVCEDKDKKFFAILTSEMPKDCTTGTALIIDDNGEIKIDKEETQRLKEKMLRRKGNIPRK